jgi:tyrosine-protein phosphatase SIW14
MKARLLAAGACCLLAWPTLAAPRPRPSDWAQPVLGCSLGNCFQVSPDLYRAEQPGPGDVADLKALGIRSIVSLREHHDDTRRKGLKEFRISQLAWDAGEVSPEQLRQALRAIRDAPKPVLVHCWHGSDRTGVVVAAYRIVFQQWSQEGAIDEFQHGGFGYHSRLYPNLVTLLQSIDAPAWRAELGLRQGQ